MNYLLGLKAQDDVHESRDSILLESCMSRKKAS